ncbi:lipopolysaccharide assembly protein LapB [Fulvivirga sp. M361]|uniref:tetratricopeptide repeat protein n=1 Tax=Fulvivirga sp. M361 TaxID=2594266 RepID=UPI002103E063|nr:tol-pal system protein YbgF [Fulvivirga sp. M361]
MKKNSCIHIDPWVFFSDLKFYKSWGIVVSIFFFLFSISASFGQGGAGNSESDQVILIADMQLQIEVNQAMNDLYNFKFDKAEQQFRWLKQKYAWHPLPYFLMGLSEWWKIMPNLNNIEHDEVFLAQMDTVISISERLLKKPEHEIEASFFLAAAYGFIGRLHSSEERRNWRKAASAGKNALKYMQYSKEKHDLSPELLFGDALYNYFSVWVPENYPLLKPILLFFPKGDKDLGIKQLKEVSFNAFYTRTEAMVFLMRILNSYENDRPRALQMCEYLNKTFPDNPYFHRYYARLLYSSGRFSQAKPVAENILARIDSGQLGYEGTSGRYAAFFLGQIYQTRKKTDEAEYYYKRAVTFSEGIGATNTGYYHFSLLELAKISANRRDKKAARAYYKKVKKYADRGDRAHKAARRGLREL